MELQREWPPANPWAGFRGVDARHAPFGETPDAPSPHVGPGAFPAEKVIRPRMLRPSSARAPSFGGPDPVPAASAPRDAGPIPLPDREQYRSSIPERNQLGNGAPTFLPQRDMPVESARPPSPLPDPPRSEHAQGWDARVFDEPGIGDRVARPPVAAVPHGDVGDVIFDVEGNPIGQDDPSAPLISAAPGWSPTLGWGRDAFRADISTPTAGDPRPLPPGYLRLEPQEEPPLVPDAYTPDGVQWMPVGEKLQEEVQLDPEGVAYHAMALEEEVVRLRAELRGERRSQGEAQHRHESREDARAGEAPAVMPRGPLTAPDILRMIDSRMAAHASQGGGAVVRPAMHRKSLSEQAKAGLRLSFPDPRAWLMLTPRPGSENEVVEALQSNLKNNRTNPRKLKDFFTGDKKRTIVERMLLIKKWLDEIRTWCDTATGAFHAVWLAIQWSYTDWVESYVDRLGTEDIADWRFGRLWDGEIVESDGSAVSLNVSLAKWTAQAFMLLFEALDQTCKDEWNSRRFDDENLNGFQRVCSVFCVVWIVYGFRNQDEILAAIARASNPYSAIQGKPGKEWKEGLREWLAIQRIVRGHLRHALEDRPEMRPSLVKITRGVKLIMGDIKQAETNELNISQLQQLFVASGMLENRDLTHQQSDDLLSKFLSCFESNAAVLGCTRTKDGKIVPGSSSSGGQGGAGPGGAAPRAHGAITDAGPKSKAEKKKEKEEKAKKDKAAKDKERKEKEKAERAKVTPEQQKVNDSALAFYAAYHSKKVNDPEVSLDALRASGWSPQEWVSYGTQLRTERAKYRREQKAAYAANEQGKPAGGGKGKGKGKGKGGKRQGGGGSNGGGGGNAQPSPSGGQSQMPCVNYQRDAKCNRDNCPYAHVPPNWAAWGVDPPKQ